MFPFPSAVEKCTVALLSQAGLEGVENMTTRFHRSMVYSLYILFAKVMIPVWEQQSILQHIIKSCVSFFVEVPPSSFIHYDE
jgi:hypothetical protein